MIAQREILGFTGASFDKASRRSPGEMERWHRAGWA
jgi:hypothetical protein